MKKIIGYIGVWFFYRLGQFINYINNEFEQALNIVNILNPFNDYFLLIYIALMEKSMIIQEWCKLNKPWQIL